MLMLFEAAQFDWVGWILIPLLIFFARVLDVSIGTLRIIYVSRGMQALATFVGFFEALIWLLAIGQIIQDLGNWVSYIAFAAGFSAGNYVGIYLENKLAIGMLCARVISNENTDVLIRELEEQNFGVTQMDAKGKTGKVDLILSVFKRKQLEQFQKLVQEHTPNAFISIEGIQSAREGFIPSARRSVGVGGK